jgi:methionyl-tRNA synthetase
MATIPTQLEANSVAAINDVGNELSQCHFKLALKKAMAIAQEANRYLDDKSPWKVIKEDRQVAADSLYVVLCVISHLRTMLYPFLPFSSQKLHEFLGFKGRVEDYGWQSTVPKPGQKLLPADPLFSKLDEELVAEETSRLGQ